MDPLFERRELVRNIHLESKFLQRNMEVSLTSQLRMKYEGKCAAEGYIARESITIVEYSLGRTNLIKGGIDYTVRFQADVCMPHPGQHFRAPVLLKSRIGIHAEVVPLKVLIPRDLHIGNATFEDIEEKQDITFEVIGIQFKQGDESIVVLGKLLETIQPAPFTAEEGIPPLEPLIAASTTAPASGDGEKKVVTVDMSATKTADTGPRRVRIKAKPASTTNESKSEGAIEGKVG